MFTLSFNFNGNEYSALVHEKYMTTGKEYRITIMNGELEKTWNGERIISDLDGTLTFGQTVNADKEKLSSCIREALSEYLMATQVY